MIGCQAYDTMASAVDVRDKAVEAWMAANPEQALMAERHYGRLFSLWTISAMSAARP